ncbi:hypothetical protein SCHPADRAFT_866786 [Schizopora paradoxa]|uniref:Uncharacterized protein n=1 Tax=Schizopora paradoxa TaxID=27342 RepID=A0A0H2SMV1_9AGAM|nr:hypothetical protein SCHPADRAFT_866786 [Schizopora paradoxa]
MNVDVTVDVHRRSAMNLCTTLLSRAIAASDASGFELDQTLFNPILLALLAKRKHIIIRSPEEDIPRILKNVVHVLHSILYLSVLKLKLRTYDKETMSPEDFLRLLFLRTSQNIESGSRPGSRKASGINESLTGTLPFKRSSSYPNTAYSFDGLYAHPRFLSENHSLFRSQTDPLQPSLLSQGDGGKPNELPQALVLTGIEHASVRVQETLWRLMTENKFSLSQSNTNSNIQNDRSRTESVYEEHAESHKDPTIFNLDENFLLVYVCPILDGRERPQIHKSLIDRFALCVDVDISSQSFSPNQRAGNLPTETHLPPQSTGLVLSPTDLSQIQRILFPPSPFARLGGKPMSNSSLSSRASLLLADLLSAVRHHPHLEGSLLSARCHAQCVDLVRAHSVLFGTIHVGQEPSPDNATDEDVRRVIMLSAVAHRLRVRDGPEEEVLASAVYPTVRDGNNSQARWKEGRRSVQEVLKDIVESF